MKKFDLNIEKILENWEVYHAIREVLANAIDEQVLTNTKPIEVFKSDDRWIIRDYGRGLKYSALTQNENDEKLSNPKVIGKFGIGLKDALATFNRNEIKVKILSRFNEITTELSSKSGFEDIITLHALINEDVDKSYVGTKVEIYGITDEDILKAKNLFLMFSSSHILSSTKFGEIISRDQKIGFIYINGVKVAEEDNFLFSYNITNVSSQIKKAINRERTNVGRNAYSDTVKKIILKSVSEEVALALANELESIGSGEEKEELKWLDIQIHAVKILNSTGKYVFISHYEAFENNSMIDEIKNTGKTPLIIPDNLRIKIKGLTDIEGNEIQDIDQFILDYNDSFNYSFVEFEELSEIEKKVYVRTNEIIELFGGLPKKVKKIRISRTMRTDFNSSRDTLGCWDSNTSSIVISKKMLKKLEDYAGTLIHELIHAKTNYDDVSREFEIELTKYIGTFLSKYLKHDNDQ
jgi:hypothetical protein